MMDLDLETLEVAAKSAIEDDERTSFSDQSEEETESSSSESESNEHVGQTKCPADIEGLHLETLKIGNEEQATQKPKPKIIELN
jgi:hypothetical protein